MIPVPERNYQTTASLSSSDCTKGYPAMRRSLLCLIAFAGRNWPRMRREFDHYLPVTIDTMVPGYYSSATPPVLTIKSGERVKVDTISLSNIPDDAQPFFVKNGIPLDNPAVRDIIAIKAEAAKRGLTLRGPLTGPIAVEGAEPGDMLEVRVLSLKFRAPYGMNGARPAGTGPLGDLTPRPWSKLYRIDPARNRAIFSPTIEMPLMPHLGQMGIAPPENMGQVPSGPPTMAHGGNFDLREITVGSSLYLPVHVKGGIFTTGDPHALQGNGEVTGTTIECNIEAILQFIVHKGVAISTRASRRPRTTSPSVSTISSTAPCASRRSKRRAS